MGLRSIVSTLGLIWAVAGTAGAAKADTLADVKARGALNCGVSEGLQGFSAKGEDGTWSGFDVDFCRAVAAAIFADPNKVRFVPLSATRRFDALKSGEIDILSRNTTWTMSRDVLLGLEFIGITYFDGQGFMTHQDNGLSSALQLGSARICILAGTTSLANAKAYFQAHDVKVELIEFDKRDEALKAYAKADCDVYSADRSALASQRSGLEQGDAHMLLPEVASKEPLGPAVRQGDPEWAQLVRWVLFLLINAEELGWTSDTAAKAGSPSPFTATAKVSAALGLAKGWDRDVIGAVGHYGEIFERNIGKESALGLGRGFNALWTRGGLLYAPPMR